MGLRINTNINAISALRNLGITDRAQSKSLERLSTGLRINRASDDPAGLVISEQLRAQTASLQQALENSEFASNLVGTADAALSEVSDLLIGIRQSAVFAMNTGGTSAEQIAAEQDAVDSAISSINRIAATTRFGSTQLLNGASRIRTSSVNSNISNLNVQSINLAGQSSRTFEVAVNSAAERGRVNFQLSGGSAAGDNVVKVSGLLGTAEILITTGTDTQDLVDSINAVRGATGVTAVLASGTDGSPAATDLVAIISEGFGSTEYVNLEVVSGSDVLAAAETGAPSALAAGSSISDYGADVSVAMAGANIDTSGNQVEVNSTFFTGNFTIADNVGSGSLSFTVLDTGLTFQLNIEPVASDNTTIGLPDTSAGNIGVTAYNLGSGADAMSVGGFLSTVISGGANDLTSDPQNALRVIDAAIDDINALRGYIGAFEANTVESNMNSLGIALENLIASESEIRDLDFAAEVAEFTRTQILFSAGTSVLATANLIPQNVLRLLA